jgi:DNA anti-recombination protein RmuC
LKRQATNVEKQLEKDAQQAGLKEGVAKLEKQIGVSGPEINRAWQEFQSQANTILNQLKRDVSQLSKNIQTPGASK